MRARVILPSALLGLATIAAAMSGCGGDPSTTGDTTTTSTSSSTTTTTTTTSTSGTGGGPPDTQHVWSDCQASDQAWTRRAIFAISGRRPTGQAEVNAYEDAVKAIRKANDETEEPGKLDAGKRAVARALMRENAFRERWSDFLLDALRINRIELKEQSSCYGPPNPSAIDGGAIAAYVRDNDPSASAPPLHDFTMGQLLSSALELDDLSVVYRGNLFAMMNRPIFGANVGPEAMERIQRQDFGSTFATAYIHRDIVCLNCHNSEYAVTFDEDPAKNRHFPIPGLFEKAIYGDSSGRHPAEEAATKGSDELRAYSVFRVMDVVGTGVRPWAWAQECGAFGEPTVDDPLKIDAYFGSVRSTAAAPTKGLRASIWDLERALHRGIDQLAQHGLTRAADGTLPDPDEAFAYLVAENIVEKVWDEVMGRGLTIANYFPRTEIARDTLRALADHFVATRFSLKSLLLDIVAHPAFNLRSPDEGCGSSPYELPNLFDPWTTADADPARRPNSPGDGVFAISPRPLVRSLHRAMGWPGVEDYPFNDDSFQVAVGFFVKDGDPGFRGLDFQGRLTWEEAYGRCANISPGDDFVRTLINTVKAKGGTVEQAMIALKDRLVGEPSIDPTERALIEAITGPLATTDTAFLDDKLRAVCGVLVSSPAFMLGGIVPKDTRDVPALTAEGTGYTDACAALASAVHATGEPFTITCVGDTLGATKKK